MDIVCCCDSNYLKHCMVMLLSVLDNNSGADLNIHVVGHNLDENDRRVLREGLNLSGGGLYFYDIDEQCISSLPKCINNYITPITYGRLFLSSILPETVKKVIYLDCDIVVVDSLERMWNTDIENFPIAAVEDLWSGKDVHYERLNIDRKYVYFNAGVLLLNLDYWRKNNIEESLMGYVGENSDRLLLADQDALNGFLCDRTLILPFRYNLQDGFYRRRNQGLREEMLPTIDEELKSPVIVHFAYKKKPWTYKCFHPYRGTYFYYLDRTPWRGERPKMSLFMLLDRFAYALSDKFGMANGYRSMRYKGRK